MKFQRPIDAVLARPGNDTEQAFACGYKVISKGAPEHTASKRRSHCNHGAYLAEKKAARTELRGTTRKDQNP